MSQAGDIEILDRFPFDVERTVNEWIPLSDGVRLAARLWRPAVVEPVPAILEYLPYRKGDSMAPRDEALGTWFAGHGYAYVRVDIRGTGDSDGLITDEYTPQEHDDAVEVIAWLAGRPWCSGAVGMVGISWGGFNGLQVASRRPPGLAAVISICSTDDRYADDVHYKGGCVLACDALPWASVMLAYNALPPDPVTVGDAWKEIWLRRLDETPPFITSWLTHQRRDDYWKHGSICEDYDQVECPVYMVGGWADGYTNAIPRTIQGLPGVRKGLIGPWPHAWPQAASPGPRIDFLGEAMRWWDRWLKDVPNGIDDEPMLRAWIQEPANAAEIYLDRPGRWVSESSWPSSTTIPRRRFLVGDGTLSDEQQDPIALRHTGAQHHGMRAGLWCPYGPKEDFPEDQREEDALCLTFDSAPLDGRMELLGYPRLHLSLAVDRPRALVAVRLCDLAPDGSSTLISRGALNLTHRDGHERPAFLEPGSDYEVDIELDALGQAVAAGHRLRVAVSTTYWPWLWPSPEPVELTLKTGSGSWIELPVRPSEEETGPPPAYGTPRSAPGLGIVEIAATKPFRSVDHEVESGVFTLSIDPDGDARYRLPDGLEIIEQTRDRFVIRDGDPLSAHVESDRLLGLERGEWRVEVRTHSVMTADADDFILFDSVQATHDTDRVFEREWERRIPRDHV